MKKELIIGEIVYSSNFEGFYTLIDIKNGLAYMENCNGIKKVELINEIYSVKK